MYNLKITLISLLLTLLSFALKADKAPIKFGKVSLEELQMNNYAPDSTASAVVLCDYGYWSLQDYKFRRVVRIKILTTEGLDQATQTYPADEGTSIRGKTYNLENGEIVEEKLKAESIYKVRIYEDYYNWRVAMPNVKVGSVIDLEYTFWGIPSIWYFQKDIPVKYSELIIPQSNYIDFRKNFFGYEALALSTSNHWIAKDMPAFKPEPFINSKENYITKFEFDLLSYHFPGYYKEFTTDWNAVARRMEESSYFGGVLNNAYYLNAVADEIEAKDSTELGRLKLAYQAAKKFKWNNEYSYLSTSTNLGSEYRDGVGNSADINLALVNLLNKLNLQTHPIIMSTRENGLLPPFFPSINKLNYVIAYAKINGIDYTLDATDEYATFDMLPTRCLNEKGFAVNKSLAQPVSLKPAKKEIITEMLILELTEDRIFKGTVSASYRDYGAFNFRHYFYSFNSTDELVDDYLENNSGISIDNYEISSIEDCDKSVLEKYDIEIKNQIQEVDGKLYFTPLFHYKTTDNPFKMEERQYPVNFAYCKQKKYIINITIPENYELVELPKPIIMSLPENGGKALYQVQYSNGKLTVLYQFDLYKDEYFSNEYKYLREYYNQIIKKQAEPVVLSKK